MTIYSLGVSGLWAKASRILVGIISSSLSLKGCGLIVGLSGEWAEGAGDKGKGSRGKGKGHGKGEGKLVELLAVRQSASPEPRVSLSEDRSEFPLPSSARGRLLVIPAYH